MKLHGLEKLMPIAFEKEYIFKCDANQNKEK